MLLIGMNFIFGACILYTIAVWSEKIQRKLKLWHLVLFWLGFCCDTVGTGAMGIMAGDVIQLSFHGITGMIAIVLMLFHSTWASVVLIKKDERRIERFHKFSLIVWIIWLIPMISGMIYGVSQ